MAFQDLFSKQSGQYSIYRPQYPKELFEFLTSLCQQHHLAWDCATGNGQAALGLVNHMENIIATDASEEQIKNCIPHERITYKVEQAEKNSIHDHSIDLITVAQAIHWFDFDVFYKEVHRVLKKEGIIAVWAYGFPMINATVDKIMMDLHENKLGEFWLPQNRMIENKYVDILFPFKQITAPEFSIEKQMSFSDFIGFIRTWSALPRFIEKYHFDPVDDFQTKLSDQWPVDEERIVRWDLILKVGKPHQ